MRLLDSVTLSVEELESIRLKDYQGLQQEESAERMGVSRPTFRRILCSARAKVADALIGGKGIRIEGGIFETAPGRYRCGWDGHEWETPPQESSDNDIRVCPKCRRSNLDPSSAEGQDSGKWGCRHGYQNIESEPSDSKAAPEEQRRQTTAIVERGGTSD